MGRDGDVPRADGGRLVRLATTLGNPLEWTDVQKSVLLFVPPMPFVVFYILRIERLLAHPEFERYIDRPSIERVEHMLFAFLLVFGALFVGWLGLRRSRAKHEWFVRTAIHTWFVSMAASAYAVGPFSSPVLLGFLAGGMTAFLLYDPRRAASGAAIGMVVLVGTTVLERMRLLPYGPVFAGVVFGGNRPPDAWVLWNLVFTMVLTGFVLAATGIVMTIARQRQAELDVLLRVDPLTGLANRRTLESSLLSEVARARRTGAGLALVMLDLDHFKRVNDTHGHRAGDAVLAAAGAAIRAVSREIDVVGRYGGEEMVLVLPGSDLDGAYAAAQRVREAIEALDVAIPEAGTLRVTASAGCAAIAPGFSSDAGELVRDADLALYRAKSLGRNRVERAEPRANGERSPA